MDRWCRTESIPRGETISLPQGWRLARAWYHDRLAHDWRRKTSEETQEIFTKLGLTAPFWLLRA